MSDTANDPAMRRIPSSPRNASSHAANASRFALRGTNHFHHGSDAPNWTSAASRRRYCQRSPKSRNMLTRASQGGARLMPREERYAVRDIAVRLWRDGQGTPLIYLHGADGCRPGCRSSSSLASEYEVLVPEHPGFGTSDNPPWIRNVGDMAMYYLDFLDELGETRARRRAFARRLDRGRSRGAQLCAARQPHRCSRRPACGSRACRAATISSGRRTRPRATCIYDQSFADQMLRAGADEQTPTSR